MTNENRNMIKSTNSQSKRIQELESENLNLELEFKESFDLLQKEYKKLGEILKDSYEIINN